MPLSTLPSLSACLMRMMRKGLRLRMYMRWQRKRWFITHPIQRCSLQHCSGVWALGCDSKRAARVVGGEGLGVGDGVRAKIAQLKGGKVRGVLKRMSPAILEQSLCSLNTAVWRWAAGGTCIRSRVVCLAHRLQRPSVLQHTRKLSNTRNSLYRVG